MDNLYNEVVMISNKCRDRAVYYGRKMRREENELVAERAAVLEQEYSIIHSDLERAIGNNPPAEDKEKPENSSQAVQQLKDSISDLNDLRMAIDSDPEISENIYDSAINAVIAKLESI